MEEIVVRRATLEEADWIVDLSARVQTALSVAGSRQLIGPLPLESTEKSIHAGNVYMLEKAQRCVGCTLVDPLDDSRLVRWGLHSLPSPLWYLHSLMLKPEEQGKRLGLAFMEGVKLLLGASTGSVGTIVLDCWAGNVKLRDFYRRANFTFHGVFPVKDFEVAVFYFILAETRSSVDLLVNGQDFAPL